MPLNLLRRFAQSLSGRSSGGSKTLRAPRFVPVVSVLEERSVPATFTVTNLLDTMTPGSLRYEVAQANAAPGADTIRFATGLAGTIHLASDIALTTDLTIEGSRAAVTVDGGNATRLFDVTGGAHVSIQSLTLADGTATGDTLDTPNVGPTTMGGAVFVDASTLAVSDVTFVNDRAVGGPNLAAGGAIAAE